QVRIRTSVRYVGQVYRTCNVQEVGRALLGNIHPLQRRVQVVDSVVNYKCPGSSNRRCISTDGSNGIRPGYLAQQTNSASVADVKIVGAGGEGKVARAIEKDRAVDLTRVIE